MKSALIREKFLTYFQKNHHHCLPSASLVPDSDPTLLFINAGMVPLKKFFTGEKTPEYSRITTAQKCLRVSGKHNDLKNVGYTARHHTFFEMLGNFSFADYGKEYAIFYAWIFLTKELNIHPEKLLVTIYHTDLESEKFWKKIANFSDKKIIKITTQDNFWSMGDNGPCGPCSEIFYDHGESFAGNPPDSKGEGGDRFIEIWNLVFMQQEKKDNQLNNLPNLCIDTGMGLERISAIIQNKHNNFDTDLFTSIINANVEITGRPNSGNDLFSHRIIADHIRASAFLITDGITPSNEGRGYVLRRIMRRAMLHNYFLSPINQKNNTLHLLIPALQESMGQHFKELYLFQSLIEKTIHNEEIKFHETLQQGIYRLNKEISMMGSQLIFNGETAFSLYDTYGFPVDLTIEILKKHGKKIDMDGFISAMNIQKTRGKSSWKTIKTESFFHLKKIADTKFLGYTTLSSSATIKDIYQQDNSLFVVTDQTPFYPEGGGQCGDQGILKTDYKSFPVLDCKKINNKIIHVLPIDSHISIGQHVNLSVDQNMRSQYMNGHTATHLLHAALKKILGDQIIQQGSCITNNGLRFDFTCDYPITESIQYEIELEVNHHIACGIPVTSTNQTYDEALKTGALIIPGMTYNQSNVRVINIQNISKELCGGTHVKNTKDILLFKIISEFSISAGIRRIEAITGQNAIKYTLDQAQKFLSIQRITGKENPCSLLKELIKKQKQLIKENEENTLKLAKLADNKFSAYNKISLSGQIIIHHYDLKVKLNHKKLFERFNTIGLFLITYYQANNMMIISIGVKEMKISAVKILQYILSFIKGKGGGNTAFASGTSYAHNIKIILKHLENWIQEKNNFSC